MSGALAHDQSVIDNRPPNVAVQFLDRVKTSPSSEAYRYPEADGTWSSMTWAQAGDRVRQLASACWRWASSRSSGSASPPARATSGSSPTSPSCAPAPPPRPSTRRRSPRTSPTSSPTPTARWSSPRTTRRSASCVEHRDRAAARLEGGHLRRRRRRRRLGDRPRRPGDAGRRAAWPTEPDDDRPDRTGHQPRRPRHPDLHLRHHRPAQGRPAAPRLLDLRGRGDPGLRHPRPRTTCSTSGCRWRTRSARCCSPRSSRSASPPPSTAGSTRSSTTSPS